MRFKTTVSLVRNTRHTAVSHAMNNYEFGSGHIPHGARWGRSPVVSAFLRRGLLTASFASTSGESESTPLPASPEADSPSNSGDLPNDSVRLSLSLSRKILPPHAPSFSRARVSLSKERESWSRFGFLKRHRIRCASIDGIGRPRIRAKRSRARAIRWMIRRPPPFRNFSPRTTAVFERALAIFPRTDIDVRCANNPTDRAGSARCLQRDDARRPATHPQYLNFRVVSRSFPGLLGRSIVPTYSRRSTWALQNTLHRTHIRASSSTRIDPLSDTST